MISDIAFNQIKHIVGENCCLLNEPMKNHTSFKIGGLCDALVIPRSIQSLVNLMKFISLNNINYMIIGNGTNLLVGDKGIRGIVIKISDLNRMKVQDTNIIAEAGALISDVSTFALANNLSKMEFAVGIPGTLGGAVAMNAGAYDSEMKNIVIKTTCLDKNGNVVVVEGDDHQFSYRMSVIQKEGLIVLESVIHLVKANPEDIKAKMEEFQSKRTEKQPLEMPSGGSVFKRPEGYFVGKLVEDCGLRGYTIGEAQISLKHCGFIVNLGNASAENVIDLIEHIKTTVSAQHGVTLETEIRIVGEV